MQHQSQVSSPSLFGFSVPITRLNLLVRLFSMLCKIQAHACAKILEDAVKFFA